MQFFSERNAFQKSVARQFIARRKYIRSRHKNRAAIKIQKCWRGYVDYSNYIVLQFENHSATVIQKYWRGFWHYSHYIILQFEAIRIQSTFRGFVKRKQLSFRRECATTIQCGIRMFLARKTMHISRVITALNVSWTMSLRTSICTKKIQRWYRKILSDRKEKSAALIIERFFIMVQVEVDREISRRKKKKAQRRRKKKEADEKLLERVWLNTVEEEKIAQDSREIEKMKSRSRSSQRRNYIHDIPSNDQGHMQYLNHEEYPGHSHSSRRNLSMDSIPLNMKSTSLQRQSSMNNEIDANDSRKYYPRNMSYEREPTRNKYLDEMNQMRYRSSPSNRNRQTTISYSNSGPPAYQVALQGDNSSEVSGITSPSVFYPRSSAHYGTASRFATLSRKDLNDDYSLEEAWIDTEINQGKERRRSEHKYLRRHGLNMAQAYNEFPASPNMQYRSHQSFNRSKRQFEEDDDDTFDPVISSHTRNQRQSSRSRSYDPISNREKRVSYESYDRKNMIHEMEELHPEPSNRRRRSGRRSTSMNTRH